MSPATPRTTVADELVTALLTASRVLVGVSAQSLASLDDSVTLPQFRALVVLSNSGEVNLNRLADDLGVNSSTALRMVDRVVASGLVHRRDNPASRREVLIGLTSAGQRVVDEVTNRRRAEIGRIVRKMPSRGRIELVAALHSFADAAGEPPPTDLAW